MIRRKVLSSYNANTSNLEFGTNIILPVQWEDSVQFYANLIKKQGFYSSQKARDLTSIYNTIISSEFSRIIAFFNKKIKEGNYALKEDQIKNLENLKEVADYRVEVLAPFKLDRDNSEIQKEFSLTDEQIKFLRELEGYILDYIDAQNVLPSTQVEITKIKPSLFNIVLDVFLAPAIVKSEAISYEGNTEKLQAIRVGTVFGFANAYFTNDKFPNNLVPSPMSYIGIKYFVKPVDKNLPDPYIGGDGFLSDLTNRLAILIGYVTGNVTFKGQQLENWTSSKWLFGLSWDSPWLFSADIGIIAVTQPDVSPLKHGSSSKGGLFLGISYDFDILNFIAYRSLNKPKSP